MIQQMNGVILKLKFLILNGKTQLNHRHLRKLILKMRNMNLRKDTLKIMKIVEVKIKKMMKSVNKRTLKQNRRIRKKFMFIKKPNTAMLRKLSQKMIILIR